MNYFKEVDNFEKSNINESLNNLNGLNFNSSFEKVDNNSNLSLNNPGYLSGSLGHKIDTVVNTDFLVTNTNDTINFKSSINVTGLQKNSNSDDYFDKNL